MAAEPQNKRRRQEVFTTGEVAEICKVSQQTVIRCFDAGKLRGFRVPGSRFRRIPRDALIQFMKEHGIPLDQLDTGKRRVLVVDDDEMIVEMLVELLERDGRFETQTATRGFEAGIKTKEFRPDAIILDYMLPDINGNAVCQTVRADPTLHHVKIIIVSGVAEPGVVEKLMASGANAFIKKPFNIDEMVNKVSELVSD
ncbi:MAG: Chemotaxis response regulator protein-glutamate methylesterase [Phycisphaerae bacterium]|nr:Chemotaxis response regulator protein-glutamate methylesterase [Phycisphaerae bacterium]